MSSLPSDSFDPVEFYLFASWLYPQSDNEAAYRTVIGRAYYAVHLCAKDCAKIKNASGSVHEEVMKHFETRNKRLFRQIKDLRDLRNKADYELSEKVLKRGAGESLRLTREILKSLKYLP